MVPRVRLPGNAPAASQFSCSFLGIIYLFPRSFLKVKKFVGAAPKLISSKRTDPTLTKIIYRFRKYPRH
jgi:hypothetical protein